MDGAVLDVVFQDLSSPAIAAELAARMRAQSQPNSKPRDLEQLKRRLAALDGKVARLVGLIAEDAEAAPAYRRAIVQMEADRAAIAAELEAARQDTETAQLVALWTAADVARMLTTLRDTLQTDLEEGRTRDLKTALAGLIERVEYDPDTRRAAICYRLDTGVKLASPRGGHSAPVSWQSRTLVGRRGGSA